MRLLQFDKGSREKQRRFLEQLLEGDAELSIDQRRNSEL